MATDEETERDCVGCPKCKAPKTKVLSSREVGVGWLKTKRRRHVCGVCGHAYHTMEIPEEIARDVFEGS